MSENKNKQKVSFEEKKPVLIFKLDLQFFAHKKGGGSASTNRSHDSRSKRLGVKIFGGERVNAGNIIVCQHGTKWGSGPGTYLSRNYTIHADIEGKVKFFKSKRKGKTRTFVSVLPFSKQE